MLAGRAGVIIVHFPGFSASALACHWRAAVTAEKLSGKKIRHLCFSAGRGSFVNLQAGLNSNPRIVGNNSRDDALPPHFLVLIYAYIFLVPEIFLKLLLLNSAPLAVL